MGPQARFSWQLQEQASTILLLLTFNHHCQTCLCSHVYIWMPQLGPQIPKSPCALKTPSICMFNTLSPVANSSDLRVSYSLCYVYSSSAGCQPTGEMLNLVHIH